MHHVCMDGLTCCSASPPPPSSPGQRTASTHQPTSRLAFVVLRGGMGSRLIDRVLAAVATALLLLLLIELMRPTGSLDVTVESVLLGSEKVRPTGRVTVRTAPVASLEPLFLTTHCQHKTRHVLRGSSGPGPTPQGMGRHDRPRPIPDWVTYTYSVGVRSRSFRHDTAPRNATFELADASMSSRDLA